MNKLLDASLRSELRCLSSYISSPFQNKFCNGYNNIFFKILLYIKQDHPTNTTLLCCRRKALLRITYHTEPRPLFIVLPYDLTTLELVLVGVSDILSHATRSRGYLRT